MTTPENTALCEQCDDDFRNMVTRETHSHGAPENTASLVRPDRIIYDANPDMWHRSVRPDRIEVLDVEDDEHGMRPAVRVYTQSGDRPELRYWVTVHPDELDRWYLARSENNGGPSDRCRGAG
jgi:hypothetical protein